MRRFASFYIVLFLIDAGHSLVDELLTLAGSPLPWLSSVRLLIAYVVIAASVVMYLCLGIDRRLPKRIFLPLTLYIAWCSLALWPLSGAIDRAVLPLVASVGQFALGLLTLILLRGWVVLPQEMFQKAAFSLRNTLGFIAINLLLAPAVLLFGMLALAGNYLEEHTAGFLRIGPTGIYMAERSYHRAGKEVRLAGMMHVGKKEYYQDLAASISAAATVILTEGVTDRDRLLEHDFDYRRLARVIGVNSQDQMQIDGNRVDLNDPTRIAAGAGDRPDIAWADIDLNRFDPQTIEFLNMIGRTMFSGRPLTEALTEYSDWAAENMSPDRIARVMADILDKRNQAVIASMAKALQHYDTIIVPWGALHMPAIEAAVLEQGFLPGEKRERMSLDFRAIPYRTLWRKWSAHAAAARAAHDQSGVD
jgi:hypothetical protein